MLADDSTGARPMLADDPNDALAAAAGCVTDATLTCLRANIEDTAAASAATTSQQNALSELSSEVLAVRAEAEAYAHLLESQVKLARDQDRRSESMRTARTKLLDLCGAQAPTPIRDVEALQASLVKQRAAILQIDAATKITVERATETLAELRRIEGLSKVLSHCTRGRPSEDARSRGDRPAAAVLRRGVHPLSVSGGAAAAACRAPAPPLRARGARCGAHTASGPAERAGGSAQRAGALRAR